MQLDDPLYMAALGAPWDMPIPPEHDQIREFLYIHMWLSFWQTFYVMGMMPEDQLRRACERELFYREPEGAPAMTSRSPDAVPGSDKTRPAKMAGILLMAAAAGALVDRIVNRRI